MTSPQEDLNPFHIAAQQFDRAAAYLPHLKQGMIDFLKRSQPNSVTKPPDIALYTVTLSTTQSSQRRIVMPLLRNGNSALQLPPGGLRAKARTAGHRQRCRALPFSLDGPRVGPFAHRGHAMNQAVVTAENLRQVYPISRGPLRAPAQLQAVSGVSFSLQAGKTLAVVGESGCGKSTLARMVTLIEKPTSGALTLGGVDVLQAHDKKALRQKVQLVFQNPYGSLNPRKRIGQILEAPLEINTALPTEERAEKARAMLAKVGLRPEHYDRYPHMFSGGQRQRIAIARALMLNPLLVVADEPVSALDVSIQAQVLNLLADLQQELGLAYLFISHDLGVVRHIAHDVLVMYLGSTVEHGDKETIFQQPLHPYTQALLASTPGLAGSGVARPRIVLKGELPSPLNPPQGCVFSTRCPHAVAHCHQERPPLLELMGRKVACFEAAKLTGV